MFSGAAGLLSEGVCHGYRSRVGVGSAQDWIDHFIDLTILDLVLRIICHVFEKVLSLFCKDVKYKLPSPIHDDRRAVVCE
jgi:hypothetical protein